MHGIVSLLDAEHWALVEQLWADLAQRFGLRGQHRTPFPHFSYQGAAAYDLALLAPALHAAAQEIAPFRVRTTGLGVFERPVLYVAVERSEALLRAHERVWRACEPAARNLDDYYRTQSWVPHITLAMHDLTPELVPNVVNWLSAREVRWEIPVTELALIYDTGEQQELRLRTPLSGDAT